MWDARQVARLLGGHVNGRNSVLAPGPGHSANDRSLSILLAPNADAGFVVFSFAGNDPIECRDYVRERLGLPPWQPGRARPAPVVDHKTPQRQRWSRDEVNRINAARGLWHKAIDPRGTLAETYLRQHRKLDLPDTLASTVLRFHPACVWRDDNDQAIHVPALLAAFRQIKDNTITAIQRVRLDVDGRKIARRMLGVVEGAAIKLGTPDNELSVGEGVETCLAAMQLGFRPAWSLGSCGNVGSLPVIDGVDRLTLLGENDEASARAVATCGQRWQRAGRKVCVVTPKDGCGDLNDELMAVTP